MGKPIRIRNPVNWRSSTININGSSDLSDAPTTPLRAKSLVITDCYHDAVLSLLMPRCKYVGCGHCVVPDRVFFDSAKTIERVYLQSCVGVHLPKHLPNATAFVITDMPDLKRLPHMPQCKVLRITKCPGINEEDIMRETVSVLSNGGEVQVVS